VRQCAAMTAERLSRSGDRPRSRRPDSPSQGKRPRSYRPLNDLNRLRGWPTRRRPMSNCSIRA
jgi:hypothetical protein